MHSDEAMTTSHSRARVFLAMSREGQLKFIAKMLRQVDTVELANMVRAIFGHSHDKGRVESQPRDTNSNHEPNA